LDSKKQEELLNGKRGKVERHRQKRLRAVREEPPFLNEKRKVGNEKNEKRKWQTKQIQRKSIFKKTNRKVILKMILNTFLVIGNFWEIYQAV